MNRSAQESDLVRGCEELARPLYAGLDGVQTFDRVERVRQRLVRLGVDAVETVDQELLQVLAVFHGVVARLGPLTPGGRLDLFLSGRGVGDERRARTRRALRRFASEPRTDEERYLHDAVLLGECGVTAAVGRLMAAGKKRQSVQRAVAVLDAGPAPERFRTAAGREWARCEQAATCRWIEELRRQVAG